MPTLIPAEAFGEAVQLVATFVSALAAVLSYLFMPHG